MITLTPPLCSDPIRRQLHLKAFKPRRFFRATFSFFADRWLDKGGTSQPRHRKPAKRRRRQHKQHRRRRRVWSFLFFSLPGMRVGSTGSPLTCAPVVLFVPDALTPTPRPSRHTPRDSRFRRTRPETSRTTTQPPRRRAMRPVARRCPPSSVALLSAA